MFFFLKVTSSSFLPILAHAIPSDESCLVHLRVTEVHRLELVRFVAAWTGTELTLEDLETQPGAHRLAQVLSADLAQGSDRQVKVIKARFHAARSKSSQQEHLCHLPVLCGNRNLHPAYLASISGVRTSVESFTIESPNQKTEPTAYEYFGSTFLSKRLVS